MISDVDALRLFIMKHDYGKAPEILGFPELDIKESMFYLYMPVSLPGMMKWIVPNRLNNALYILLACMIKHEGMFWYDKYVYLTAKRMFVTPGNYNRPGWHSDGFGTKDINYIWYDKCPTEFCIQPFVLSMDDKLSMVQMEEQVKPENIVSYGENAFMKLTPENIHRVSTVDYVGMRTFIKISVSDHQYNLEGNTINHELDYDWEMLPREHNRNNPYK